jgi:hypothetical protein
MFRLCCADKALALGLSASNARCTAEALVLKAHLKLKMKESEAGEAVVAEGIALSTRAARPRNLSELKLLLSCIRLSKRHWSSAGRIAEQALRIAERCQARPIVWQARHVLGKVHMKKGERIRARDELKQAEEVVRSMVEGLSDDLRKLYLARPAYRELLADLEAVT